MPATTTSKGTLSLSRRTLGAQLFLLSGAPGLGTVLLAVGLPGVGGRQVGQQAVRGALDKARSAQRRVVDQRLGSLRLIGRFLGGDPSFVAYVAESDPASIRDLILERQQELGADFA